MNNKQCCKDCGYFGTVGYNAFRVKCGNASCECHQSSTGGTVVKGCLSLDYPERTGGVCNREPQDKLSEIMSDSIKLKSALVEAAKKANEDQRSYNYISHVHCFSSENPPCGLKGTHCCLCDIATGGTESPPPTQADNALKELLDQKTNEAFSQPVTPVVQEWEKEFDRLFLVEVMCRDDGYSRERFVIKNFIRSLLAEREKEAFDAGYKHGVEIQTKLLNMRPAQLGELTSK